jgi:alkylhydroperoxidase family enzyme
MARIKLIYRPSDYPGNPDDATKTALDELFQHMFPGQSDPKIAGDHSAMAAVAHNPLLALHMAKLSAFIVRETSWSAQNRALRQLAIQTLNLQLKCEFSFQSHLRNSMAVGISLEQQACIPFWRTSNVFNEEQKLVIEYTLAVISGEVPEELFAKVVGRYGEKGAVECTTCIAWFSLWALIINATRTDFDLGYGKASAEVTARAAL